MRRAQQIAEIDGLGDALHANGEIAARYGERGFHGPCLPQSRPAGKGEAGRTARAPLSEGLRLLYLATKPLEAARCALRKFPNSGALRPSVSKKPWSPRRDPAKSWSG